MSKTSRLTIASLIIAGGWIQAAGAADEAQGGLERRLEELRNRFTPAGRASAGAVTARKDPSPPHNPRA